MPIVPTKMPMSMNDGVYVFQLDGIRRLEEQGVTEVIVGFRWPYTVGPDTQPLQEKLDHLRRYADRVMSAYTS